MFTVERTLENQFIVYTGEYINISLAYIMNKKDINTFLHRPMFSRMKNYFWIFNDVARALLLLLAHRSPVTFLQHSAALFRLRRISFSASEEGIPRKPEEDSRMLTNLRPGPSKDPKNNSTIRDTSREIEKRTRTGFLYIVLTEEFKFKYYFDLAFPVKIF